MVDEPRYAFHLLLETDLPSIDDGLRDSPTQQFLANVVRNTSEDYQRERGPLWLVYRFKCRPSVIAKLPGPKPD